MLLPRYRYTPAITEALAELERLRGRAAGDPAPAGVYPAWRAAQAARAAGAAALDGIAVSAADADAILAGRSSPLPHATHLAVRGYAFALDQIAGDWPADRAVTTLPVIAGLHFFVTQDPDRRGHPPGLRRQEAALVDVRDGRSLAPAPPPAAIRPALLDLTGWLHAAGPAVASAICAGLAYWRLTAIQPQQEANARLACAYTALLLHRAGLLPHGLPAFEAGLAADLDRYYAALRAAPPPADGAVPEATAWLEYFLGVLRDAWRATTGVPRASEAPSGTPVVRLNPRQRRILELLGPPGASLANQECQQLFAVSPVTAARDFHELIALGLVEMRGQGRATYYVMRNTQHATRGTDG